MRKCGIDKVHWAFPEKKNCTLQFRFIYIFFEVGPPVFLVKFTVTLMEFSIFLHRPPGKFSIDILNGVITIFFWKTQSEKIFNSNKNIFLFWDTSLAELFPLISN